MSRNIARDSKKAWLIVGLTSFWTCGIVEGSVHSFAVFYAALENRYSTSAARDGSAASELIGFRVALIGSAMLTINSLGSIVAGILTDILKAHVLLLIGTLCSCTGLLLSTISESIEVWYVTYSLIYGIGNAFCWVAYMAILGDYFDKHYALAYSLTSLGSTMSIAFTIIYQRLIDLSGVNAALYFVAAMFSSMIVCVLVWPTRSELSHCVVRVKPPKLSTSDALSEVADPEKDLTTQLNARGENQTDWPNPQRTPCSTRRNSKTGEEQRGAEDGQGCCFAIKRCVFFSAIRWNLFRHRNFLIFTLAMILVLTGSAIPDIHIVKFAQTALEQNNSENKAESKHSMITLVPLIVYAGSSSVSKLIFAFWIAKCRTNQRVAAWLYQLSCALNGIAMTAIPFFALDLRSVTLTLLCCSVWGFADGPGYSLYVPVLRILVGARDTAQAATYSYAVAQTVALVGAPLGGLIFDKFQSYEFAFLISGTFVLIGCCLFSTMRFPAPGPELSANADTDADADVDTDMPTELSSAATLKNSATSELTQSLGPSVTV